MSVKSNRYYIDLGRIYTDVSFLRGVMVGGKYGDDKETVLWRLNQARRGVTFREPPCYLMFTKDVVEGAKLIDGFVELCKSEGIQKSNGIRLIQVLNIDDIPGKAQFGKLGYEWLLYIFDEELLGDGLICFYQGVMDYLLGEGIFIVDRQKMNKFVRLSAENQIKFNAQVSD